MKSLSYCSNNAMESACHFCVTGFFISRRRELRKNGHPWVKKISGQHMNPETLKFIEASIKTIPNYPKPGILFRDITSLIENAEAFKATIDLLANHYRDQGITKIVGTEARGFIFGAPVAFAMGLGFVPVRKPGKLPRDVIEESYALEYGTDTLQLHTDAIVPGDKVLVVDDLLATGGTVDATVKLIRRAGGEVADAAFIISLPSLGGDARLTAAGIKVVSLVELAGE